MEFFTVDCSHDEKEIKKAYKAAVEKCLVSLHHQDKRGRELPSKYTCVCCNYQDSTIKVPQVEALKALGVSIENLHCDTDQEGNLYCGPKSIACLFFEMAKTQIPGFEYKLSKEKKTINGFWSGDFNHQLGYGCFGG